MWVGGPGGVAFPVAALLWCALTYTVFTTALISFMSCTVQFAGAAAGFFDVPLEPVHAHSLVSIRPGIALLSLGPLAVAVSNASRAEALARLDRAVARPGRPVCSRAARSCRTRASAQPPGRRGAGRGRADARHRPLQARERPPRPCQWRRRARGVRRARHVGTASGRPGGAPRGRGVRGGAAAHLARRRDARGRPPAPRVADEGFEVSAAARCA